MIRIAADLLLAEPSETEPQEIICLDHGPRLEITKGGRRIRIFVLEAFEGEGVNGEVGRFLEWPDPVESDSAKRFAALEARLFRLEAGAKS